MKQTQTNVERVAQVYSGRASEGDMGCMCGCRGKYYEDDRNKRRVLKVVMSADDRGWDVSDDGVVENVHAVVNGRTYVVYFKG